VLIIPQFLVSLLPQERCSHEDTELPMAATAKSAGQLFDPNSVFDLLALGFKGEVDYDRVSVLGNISKRQLRLGHRRGYGRVTC
jgi:hypothetical protein